jgi:hypothetical protein
VNAAPIVETTADVQVCGGSDDLIELRGAITEEWLHYGPGPARVAFDNGVVLDIEYDRDRDGIWRISIIAGHDHARVLTCPDPTAEDDYTDTAIVTGARAATFGDRTSSVR